MDDLGCSWIGRLNIVNCSIDNPNPSPKPQQVFFIFVVQFNELTLGSIWKCRGQRKAQTLLRKNNVGCPEYQDFHIPQHPRKDGIDTRMTNRPMKQRTQAQTHIYGHLIYDGTEGSGGNLFNKRSWKNQAPVFLKKGTIKIF